MHIISKANTCPQGRLLPPEAERLLRLLQRPKIWTELERLDVGSDA